ncbi:hypothetical protein ACOSP7_007653 [Xanthoceras sorbifolium]
METRGKTNVEFRNEANETLGRHESNFDQLNGTLQTVLTELQSLRIAQNFLASSMGVNPFALTSTSSEINQTHVTQTSTAAEANHVHIKLNFSKFDGTDPNASFHLKGIALQWHRWFTKFKGPVTWEKFTKAVLQRFGLTDYEDPSEVLTRLKQTSTVVNYQEEFENFRIGLMTYRKIFLVSCFVAGLKDEVRLDVKVKQPRSLANAIGIARLIEERNALQRKNHHQKSVPGSPQLLITFKRITGQEARERHQKGLCYYCDEKYVAGHRCKRPQLFMMEDFSPRDENNIVDDLSQ